jgi:SAM-dependent methyltransferase
MAPMSGAGGFPEEVFERLAELERGHYWFENRNRLIVWALRRYFPQAKTLAEVGCGTGFVLQAIHHALPHLELTATDVMPAGLAIAARRVPAATLLPLDARQPLPGQFDVVAALDVLEHVPEDEQAIAQLFAATRPGGGAIVTVPQHQRLWSRRDELSGHVRRYGRHQLIARLQRAGFDVIRTTSFVTLLLPLMALSRWRERRRADEYDPFLELRVPRGLNAVLTSVLAIEAGAIRAGLSWPAGGSLLAIAARRPDREPLGLTEIRE